MATEKTLPLEAVLMRNAEIGEHMLEGGRHAPGGIIMAAPVSLAALWERAWFAGHAFSSKRIAELEAKLAKLEEAALDGAATVVEIIENNRGVERDDEFSESEVDAASAASAEIRPGDPEAALRF